ncbi:uncharacterized protein L3040_009077 [Drepanopeziza brunnea f. sp. 'multigermtubi']|uniref:uncharacterized protein n=1 Tax=Drepanopeziza brunnea f. sp. 'multigermtubi' TaxID=698441 RepID=UPI002397A9DC|nr:hypothetical protein L3040_009077 [Drepanopeziza brunnea f. sp. 'multigermtubi']
MIICLPELNLGPFYKYWASLRLLPQITRRPHLDFASIGRNGKCISQIQAQGLVLGQLPTIYERHMGDLPGRAPSGDLANRSQGQRQSIQSHYSEHEGHPFSLIPLANSLPDPTHQNYGRIPRYSSALLPSPLYQQFQDVPRFSGQPGMSHTMADMQYGIGPMVYQTQYPGMYTPNHVQPPHNIQTTLGGGNQYYQSQVYMGQQLSPNYLLQPGQYSQVFTVPATTGPYGARSGLSGDVRLPGQRAHDYLNLSGSGTTLRSSTIGPSSPSTVVRGPPRKPRRSGHAIWIGNLPPQTDLMSLVLHICKEAPGLESLFLISKSNCAFANFKDEEACSNAQAKIHESRFQTARLVSRLRRNSVGTATGVVVPTGPAALSPPTDSSNTRSTPLDSDNNSKEVDGEVVGAAEVDGTGSPEDKFFIVKSLTVEDMDLSVRNGIWATQSHNEDALNEAYQTAGNVYLIFSANKSGEYFGYAKMKSPINDDPAAAIEFAPQAHTVEDPELPKAIPTPASEFAPKGRIIDDSARGTIFWEVEKDEIDGVEEEDESPSNRSDEETDSKSSSKAWGKPFQVEWMCTARLPFYRTRGLRNPWNSNREVKIARDGTELETSVGKRLISLFHQLPSPVAPNMPTGPLHGGMPVIGAYPEMRPFQ